MSESKPTSRMWSTYHILLSLCLSLNLRLILTQTQHKARQSWRVVQSRSLCKPELKPSRNLPLTLSLAPAMILHLTVTLPLILQRPSIYSPNLARSAWSDCRRSASWPNSLWASYL